MKKHLSVLAVMLTAGCTSTVLSQGPALPPGEYDLEAGQYVFNVEDGATLSAPTDTPIPATPVPPSQTPAPPTDVPGVHNDTEWHPVSADVSHTHNANPSSGDYIFGPISDYLDQGISYPWQTWHGLDADLYGPQPAPGSGLLENEFKHEGYKWMVEEINTCMLGRFYKGPVSSCVVAWRIEHHAVGGAVGAAGRIHSFWAELKVCSPASGIEFGPSLGEYAVNMDDCGFIRMGGFMDTCGLRIKFFGERVDIPNQAGEEWDVGGYCYKEHELYDPEIHWDAPGARTLNIYNWSSTDSILSQGVQFSFSIWDDWAPLDPNDPITLNFDLFAYPDFQGSLNHSMEGIYAVGLQADYIEQFDDGSGYANFEGKVDRYGSVVPDGCALGPDCIPLIIENVQTGGRVEMRRANIVWHEYDLSPPGEWWIEYPN